MPSVYKTINPPLYYLVKYISVLTSELLVIIYNFLDTIFTFGSAYVFSFIKMLSLFLVFTMIIAAITLVERKVLSLLQRRVGPNYVGYRGRLQFIADAFKMLLKHIAIINKINRALFIAVPAMLLVTTYLFWANISWGPNLAVCEVEHNVLLLCVSSSSVSYLLLIVGFISNNKYAMLSSVRTIALGLVVEILLTLLLVLLAFISSSLSFAAISTLQSNFKLNLFFFLPIFPIVFMTFLLEIARIPFDLVEADSELIAGLTTEFGGFYFALFYLGEYFHLFCYSTVYALIFFGGWH